LSRRANEPYVEPPPAILLPVSKDELSRALRDLLSGYHNPLQRMVETALETVKPQIEALVIDAVKATVTDPAWVDGMRAMVRTSIQDGIRKRVENRIGSIGAKFIVTALAGKEIA
jgi:predicted YcjX-like family ATPase